MKLKDLKDLEFIKETLPPEPVLAETSEKSDRGERLAKGSKIRIMDREGVATILELYDDSAKVELDGLIITVDLYDIIESSPDEDAKLMDSFTLNYYTQKQSQKPVKSSSSEITVDLHMEKIPGSYGVPKWAALEFQMNYFREILHDNIKHRGRHITFIHGIGDGVLAQRIRKELDEVFALTCRYTVGPMGETKVIIK